MTRAGGWIRPHGPLALISGSLLATGCFFQPMLGSTGGGTGTGAGESGSTAAADTEVVPTTGAGTANETVSETAGDTSLGTSGEASVCGDFQVDEGEQCDNGTNNGGGAVCKEDCTINVCGDGYTATALEGCDDGNLVSGDGCSDTCALESCGDGVVSGIEECDDGDAIDDDECSNLCRLPVCGDGIVNGDEQCDDPNGNTEKGTCVPGCELAVCGDGFVQVGEEECDDGDADDSNGCGNDCKLPVCGDGEVGGDEQCDDANDVDTDACRSNCKDAKCGDGVVFSGIEECDEMSVVCTLCERSGWRVFVTSMQFKGNEVDGTAAADATCTALAAGTMFAGDYKAWLSSSLSAAANRLDKSMLPYFRTDDVMVAKNWSELASANHLAPINVTEGMATLPASPASCAEGKTAAVWTGSMTNGLQTTENCENWTNSQFNKMGQGGLFNRADLLWSGCSFTCNLAARLYCVEQPP